MPNYPGSNPSFTAKAPGQTITSAGINAIADEVVAIGTGLVTGPLGHSLNTNGQIIFPATQNASANANTLDDYEEGTCTPAITFATPGNLNVVYSSQSGSYTKIGNKVTVVISIVTTTFTHTTASGACSITGLPFSISTIGYGPMFFTGITKANYTNYVLRAVTGTTLDIVASGSGQTAATVTTADMPSGTQQTIAGIVTYFTA